MADERYRSAQRSADGYGSAVDQRMAALVTRVRRGEIPVECVAIAAGLGDKAAKAVGPSPIKVRLTREEASGSSVGKVDVPQVITRIATLWAPDVSDFWKWQRIIVSFFVAAGRKAVAMEMAPGIRADDEPMPDDVALLCEDIMAGISKWVSGQGTSVNEFLNPSEQRSVIGEWGLGGAIDIIAQTIFMARARSRQQVVNAIEEAVFSDTHNVFRQRIIPDELIRHALGEAPVFKAIGLA